MFFFITKNLESLVLNLRVAHEENTFAEYNSERLSNIDFCYQAAPLPRELYEVHFFAKTPNLFYL